MSELNREVRYLRRIVPDFSDEDEAQWRATPKESRELFGSLLTRYQLTHLDALSRAEEVR